MSRTRSRNDEEKSQRREAILDAAMDIFLSKGFEKTSMDDIAKQAKLSRSLIYVYFKDKDDVHMGLCLRAGYTLLTIKNGLMADSQSGIEKIRSSGDAYYTFYKQHPELFTILTKRLTMQHTDIAPGNETPAMIEMAEVEDQIMQQMVEAILLGIEDGTIDKDKIVDPLLTAMFLRGALFGVISLQDASGSRLFDRRGLDREELIHYSRHKILQAIARVPVEI
ncbi:MAG: TetR/AcrR family transcriptional regulator [Pseudomonadales bacterium]|nr:TetR/AcrR family transcriptional regulator [Pseudomonadales bacterium]